MKGFHKAMALGLAVILVGGLSSCKSAPASADAELIDDIDEITEDIIYEWDDLPDMDLLEMVTEPFELPDIEEPIELEAEFSDDEFENKTVKWLAHFDPWSRSVITGEQCSEETMGAELFDEIYGGEIQWYSATWDSRFSDLEAYILGGEGIDLFTGIRGTPKCVLDRTVQSYDRYVDWDDPLWSSVKDLNDPFAIDGKHYLINCQEKIDSAVFYNMDIIRENGLDDPWELYKSGRWTMGKFMEMMEEYADGRDGRYGLGSYFNSSAQTRLYLSGGVSPVSMRNGRLVNNIDTPAFEQAMDYQFELYRLGLVLDDNMPLGHNRTADNNILKNGEVLFYVADTDFPSSDPTIDLESLGIAPMPRDEQADRYYHPMDVYGYYLCQGAENPMGAIKLTECVIASRNDETIQAQIRDFYKTEYNYPDELFERIYEIRRLARENPSFDILPGLPDDIAFILDNLIYKQIDKDNWTAARESVSGTLDMLIGEANFRLDAVSGQFDNTYNTQSDQGWRDDLWIS
ncbi:MAG: extracellular solute-binding protein [Oscillospiraceae bacterium]|nr:extracellular solute-binding protein [Oscillospiraceae bacterium]